MIVDLRNDYRESLLKRVQKKLNNLYNGELLLPNETNKYFNLSNHQLSDNENFIFNQNMINLRRVNALCTA